MKGEFIPVENRPDLVRDKRTGAVICINKDEMQRARQAKRMRQDRDKQQAQLREDVDNLKSELQDIKSLLTKIVEKL